jgi:hopene-associated glycosyltransferase HpnB
VDVWIVTWAAGVAAVWILFHLDRARAWPHELRLPLDPGAAELEARPEARPDPGAAELIVVVPARNEADVVETALSALAAQAADFDRLYYVDDRSTDGTASRAARIAASASRSDAVVVVRAAEPPPGWTGKIHALHCGLEHALSDRATRLPEWILFTDADIEHPPGSIRALRRVAASGPYDYVSVMVRLRAESFWERLLIPPFVFFFHAIYPFRRVRDPSSRCAAGAGGCVLIRRQALEKAGGLAAIAGAVIDDVSLARAVKAAGGRLWLGLCADMVSLRRYERFDEITQMVARTAFTQLRESWTFLVGALIGIGLFLVSPPILVAIGAIGRSWPTALAGAVAWGAQALALEPSVRHHRVPAIFAFGLPIASAFYGYMTALSGWRHASRKGVAWRGRTVGAPRAPREF